MGLKHYKNLTWQTKGRHDECTDSPRARLTDSTTLLQHPPPLGIDMEVPSQPMASRLRDWAWQWDQPEQQAPCVFSHRSDQKPGYRQVLVRRFWSVLRLDISVSKFWRFWMAVSCSIQAPWKSNLRMLLTSIRSFWPYGSRVVYPIEKTNSYPAPLSVWN